MEATRWDRGAAVSLSPPQGRPSPLLWSPWQPQPLPLLDLSTKVNWWLWMSLGVSFLPCVLCDLGPTAESCVALIYVVQLVCDFHNQWPCLEETHREKELMYKHAGRSKLKSRQRTQQLSVSTVLSLNLLSGVFMCVFLMELSLCGFGPHVFFQGSMSVNGRTVMREGQWYNWDKAGKLMKCLFSYVAALAPLMLTMLLFQLSLFPHSCYLLNSRRCSESIHYHFVWYL